VEKIRQVSDPTGTYGFAYDNMGRLIGTTTQYSSLPNHTFSNTYAYDAASNRISLSADGTSTTYAYDTLNRLTDLTSAWAGHFSLGYDSLGRRTALNRPNAINTSYSYDSVSHLLSVLHQAGGGAIDGAGYTYDGAGNRTSKTNYLNSTSEQYTYDAIYQLTQVTQGGSTAETYSYDQVGNRLSSVGTALYSYNSANELTSTSSATFAYDYNGNTTSKTDANGTTGYAWDFENRLTSVTLPNNGGVVTLKYDPFGRRIQKIGTSTTTVYAYEGANIIGEYDSTGNAVVLYAQGPGVDAPLALSKVGAISYYEADGIGSVTSLTDSSGSAVAAYTRDAFGKALTTAGTIGNRYRYSGREWDDDAGLYYYRARYYDPTLGRFNSEDALRFVAGGNFNRIPAGLS
jgi:RHS repeat-associated protein